jgi:hypothetical protein
MIVQITHARDELVLIKELLPIWQEYADGFVFFLDRTTDDSFKYLTSDKIKKKYNILEVIESNEVIKNETDSRQISFDVAKKYSDKILCLDADEYLDGNLKKETLEKLLDENKDANFWLEWIQYTSDDKIRIDGKWKDSFVDRIGNYTNPKNLHFEKKIMHSSHLPICSKRIFISKNDLFVAHLQWLNKYYVAIKQYFWKVLENVNRIQFNEYVCESAEYDRSVNDFLWTEVPAPLPLKIDKNIFKHIKNSNNYRLKFIKEMTDLYSLLNLGDWGMNIVNANEMYFCSYITTFNFEKIKEKIEEIYDKYSNQFEWIILYTNDDINYEFKNRVIIKKIDHEFDKKYCILDSTNQFPYVFYFDEFLDEKKIDNLNMVFSYMIKNNKKSNIKMDGV